MNDLLTKSSDVVIFMFCMAWWYHPLAYLMIQTYWKLVGVRRRWTAGLAVNNFTGEHIFGLRVEELRLAIQVLVEEGGG
eukprot:CAMPEP_0118922356 /NCGR_PEP_ID=MMETSP1169-20130426/1308_1 /TAXON_ID=36882 /ORGANISM="Pyramimonas obovata, Strain CCMP722" /LENGTH=78 /DNA_ID=CAMNT_0006863203 /DNA_START=81 /DNA_END=314 /DNA_ORIENTATION=+